MISVFLTQTRGGLFGLGLLGQIRFGVNLSRLEVLDCNFKGFDIGCSQCSPDWLRGIGLTKEVGLGLCIMTGVLVGFGRLIMVCFFTL